MYIKKNSFYRKNKKGIWILSFILVVIAVRIALPYVLLNFANQKLADLKGYYGHIDDIDLAIYRGAYKIKDAYLNKVDTNTQKETPFIESKIIDLSVEWKSLFKGRIVGELYVTQPVVIFTKDAVEPADVQKDSSTLKDLFDNMMPLKVNRFEINQGRIRYKDPAVNPPVDIAMEEIYVLAQNLSSVVDSNKLLPGSVYAEADLYRGKLTMNLKIDPLNDKPTFDLNAELKNTSLPLLNDFFKAYGKFDVNKGKFGLYTEFAAKNGKFDGYVKPIIVDLDVLGKEDRKDSFLHKLWEGFVGTVGEIFQNQKKDQFATKIPIKGAFKDPNIQIWTAIVDVLRNAFVQALQPSVDNKINIASVEKTDPEKKKTFLEKIFSKK